MVKGVESPHSGPALLDVAHVGVSARAGCVDELTEIGPTPLAPIARNSQLRPGLKPGRIDYLDAVT